MNSVVKQSIRKSLNFSGSQKKCNHQVTTMLRTTIQNQNSLISASASVPCRNLAYATVNHSMEYKEAMDGRHGQQLQLAYQEGQKYDTPVFDPFEAYKIEDDDAHDSDENELDMEDLGLDENLDAMALDNSFDDDNEHGADGSVTRSKAERVSFKAGAPAGGKFAIVNLYGSQHKVTVDDMVILNKLQPVEKWAVGTTHTLNADDGQLLLMGSQEQTFVGLPYVNGGEVDVMVEEITRDKKVIVFKKKRRKNYRRKNGFKREVTFLRVLDIRFPQENLTE